MRRWRSGWAQIASATLRSILDVVRGDPARFLGEKSDQTLGLPRLDLFLGRDRPLLELQVVAVREAIEAHEVGRGDQRYHDAAPPDAAGAARPMDVGLGRIGSGIDEDVGELLDVDPAGGDVRRHQVADVAGAEAGHHLLALLLGEIAQMIAAGSPRRTRKFATERTSSRVLQKIIEEVG